MPLWTLFANMCPLYLIVQWQQIYVAKLQKVNPTQIPPQTTDTDQGNTEFNCLHRTVIISRFKLPVSAFGHFSHSNLALWCSLAREVFYSVYCHLPPIPESSVDLLGPLWLLTTPTPPPAFLLALFFPWKSWLFQKANSTGPLGWLSSSRGWKWDKRVFFCLSCTVINRIIW